MPERLSTERHLQHFVDAHAKMAEIAPGSIDQDSRDRFAMLSVIADNNWRVVSKFLPPETTDDGFRLVKVLSHEAWLDAMSDEDKALA